MLWLCLLLPCHPPNAWVFILKANPPWWCREYLKQKLWNPGFITNPLWPAKLKNAPGKQDALRGVYLWVWQGLFYFLWCVWTLLHIRQIPSTRVYKIPRHSFYDVFEIPKAELLVDDLSFFFDTPAGDYPSKNRVANFLETRDHVCWLHLCTRTNIYYWAKWVATDFWNLEALGRT